MEYMVSVIVPVYNTDKYLAECIESVLSQGSVRCQLLLIDDGSTDRSLEIAQSYAKRHENVMVLRQDRKRQGAARNLAFQYAQGQYVAFLDSDDTVPSNAYQMMVEAAERNGSDMVCGIQQSFSQWRKWVGVPVHQREFNRVIERTSIREMPTLIGDISACNRLIRRSTIERAGLRFAEGTADEDLDFMARFYLECEVITVLPEVVYNY